MTQVATTPSFLDQPCDRCGSKRKVSRTWNEKIQMSSGTSTVVMSQIICTNKACQKAFDEERAIEMAKVAARKAMKVEQDLERSKNIAKTILLRKKLKVASK